MSLKSIFAMKATVFVTCVPGYPHLFLTSHSTSRANVGFLAIPGIDHMPKTASLVSTLFSLTSIIAGVHHVWRHRTKVDAEFEDARKYLYHVRSLGEELDLTVTACLISLPIAALIWSILSFSLAIAGYSIQYSNLSGRILLSAVLGASGIGAFSVLVYFWRIWKAPNDDEEQASSDVHSSLITTLWSWVKGANLKIGLWRKQVNKGGISHV